MYALDNICEHVCRTEHRYLRGILIGTERNGVGDDNLGKLAASILDMKFKDVLIACMGGVLLAGIIMGLASAGLLGALSGLFAV